MDWKFNFTPSDVLDLTVKQAAQKVNPKIVLTVRIGKGFVGAGLPILLEDINFVGHIRLRMKLMSAFPHVQLVDLSFMEPPRLTMCSSLSAVTPSVSILATSQVSPTSSRVRFTPTWVP